MLTLATVEIPDSALDDSATIYVDIDDSGSAYIKQGDDWIEFPVKYTDRLIAALQNVWRK